MSKHQRNPRVRTAVTLRTVAERCGLAPCSVSAVLNNSPAARAIPQHTKDRVMRAVKHLNYCPNFSARSLRTKRTFLVALIASDLGRSQVAPIVSGVEAFLRAHGYGLLIANWERTPEWFGQYSMHLLERGVEGVITIGVSPGKVFALPLVWVDLPGWQFPEPITPLKRQRLAAMGGAAAQSLLRQIEQKTGDCTKVGIAPEPVSPLPPETAVTVRPLF
jgi:DNA-binding LacI/PurR family transcriptional regulator